MSFFSEQGNLEDSTVLALDWAERVLGPRTSWGAGLRIALDACFLARTPFVCFIGDENVTLGNRSFAELVGLDATAFLAQPLHLVMPELWSHISPTLDAVRRRTQVLQSEAAYFTFDAGGTRQDRTLIFTCSPIVADETINGVFCHVHETTLPIERDHHEALRLLGEHVPHIAFTARVDGYIDWYNQAWMDFTGQSPREAAGWGWQSAHHPEDFPEVMRRWPESLRNGTTFEMEFRLRGADGTYRWFLGRIKPYRDGRDRIVRWFGTYTDVEAHKTKLENSQRIAETIQRIFLPDRLPQNGGAMFDAFYMPAESTSLVGGDWYDAFSLANGSILLSIGDVAGHGLEAAVLAGRLRQSIFSEALDNPDPAVVLMKADRLLRAQSSAIVTALVAIFDPQSGTLRYASAGHPTPILASPGKAALSLPCGALPLGIGLGGVDLDIKTQFACVPEEAVVLLYTDGVTEFTRNILATESLLLQAVERVSRGELPDSAQAVYHAVIGNEPVSDDVAILLMRRTRTVPKAASLDALGKTWRFHSSDAHSAHMVRLELMAFLQSRVGTSDALFESELIIGELLANVVEHAPGLVEIIVDWNAGPYPSVKCRDSGPGFDISDDPQPTDSLCENGRGLYLIKTLAKFFSAKCVAGLGSEVFVILPIVRSENAIIAA